MKIIFIVLLFIHALIHLMGFLKAFQYYKIEQLTQNISKPIGLFWLFVAILFLASIILYIYKSPLWFYICTIGIIISQILIIIYWKDAKYGTVINLITLLVCVQAYGNYRFNTMVEKEFKEVIKKKGIEKSIIIKDSNTNQIPEIVEKWIKKSGATNQINITNVHLKQKGVMRIKANSKWMPFTAEQYFNVTNPSFVWSVNVEAFPNISIVGRDKMNNENGEMLIKIMSLFPIVNEKNNPKVNSATMTRFLSEICWFPSAALNNYITWRTIDHNSAEATLTLNNISVSGIFKFNHEGDLILFETNRYFGGDVNSKLEKWEIKNVEFKTFNGYRIPNKSEVTWKLKEGDFNWLNIEIINIDYNLKDFEKK